MSTNEKKKSQQAQRLSRNLHSNYGVASTYNVNVARRVRMQEITNQSQEQVQKILSVDNIDRSHNKGQQVRLTDQSFQAQHGRTTPSPEEKKKIFKANLSDQSNDEENEDLVGDNLFKMPLMPTSVQIMIDNMEVADESRLREDLGIKSHRSSPSFQASHSVQKVLQKRDSIGAEEFARPKYRSQSRGASSSGHGKDDESNSNSQASSCRDPSTYPEHVKTPSVVNSSIQKINIIDVQSNEDVAHRSMIHVGKMESTIKTVIIDSVENSEGDAQPDKKSEKLAPKLARKTLAQQTKKLLSVESKDLMSTNSFNTFRTDQSARYYFTIEKVAEVFQKHPKERSQKELHNVHAYMVDNVAFFRTVKQKQALKKMEKRSTPHLTREDKMKMFEVMQYKVYNQGDNLCQYMTYGDRFFVILDGIVGIRVPNLVEPTFNSTWDLFNYVLKNFDTIRQYKDNDSKECQTVISLIGQNLLKEQKFVRVTQLVTFIKTLEVQDSEELEEQYEKIDLKKIRKEMSKISNLRKKLVKQFDRIADNFNGSVSKPQPTENQIHTKLQVMEHVNQLVQGQSFGQDSLIADAPRNATCYSMSDKVITAVLLKNDYNRVLLEREKQHIDMKLNQIIMFDLFKNVAKRRLKNVYRFFYNQKTQEPYEALRNQYLYRQGDPVDGIYCILSGQVKRIKEAHQQQTSLDREAGKNQLDTLRQLKMKKAKQIVLTIIQKGESVGVEEVVMKLPGRQFSIQVASENCLYLFLSTKNFREKFFNQSHQLKHELCEQTEMREQFVTDLNAKKTAFQVENGKKQLQNHHQSQEALSKKKNEPLSMRTIVRKKDDLELQLSSHPSKIKQMSELTDRKLNQQSSKQLNYSTSEPAFRTMNQMPTQSSSQLIPLHAADVQDNFFTSLGNENQQLETVMERLEQQINNEIDKNKPNVKKLMADMRERRKEIAQDLKENNSRAVARVFSSQSKPGKFFEQKLVRQFTAMQTKNKDQTSKQQQNNQVSLLDSQTLNIETITGMLVQDADDFYSMWKHERNKSEVTELILQSLTTDKRIHRQLRGFGNKLDHFLKFVRQQGRDFINNTLKAPVFPGSLLYDDNRRESANLQSGLKRSLTTKNKGSQHEKSINHSHHRSPIHLQNRFNAKKRSDVAGGLVKSPTLELPSEANKSIAQSTSVKKRSASAAASQKADDEDSEEAFDLMKYFLEWNEHFTKQISLQQFYKGKKQSVDELVEKAKATAQRALDNVTSSLASLQNTQPRKPKVYRKAVSQVLSSGERSTLSGKSQPQSTVKSPQLPLSFSPKFQQQIPFKRNMSLVNFDEKNETSEMIKIDHFSVVEETSQKKDIVAPNTQVSYSRVKQAMRKVADDSGNSSSFRRITSMQHPITSVSKRQQFKWLRPMKTEVKMKLKKSKIQGVGVAIPRASQIEAEANIKRDNSSAITSPLIGGEGLVGLVGDPSTISKPQSSIGEPLRLPPAFSAPRLSHDQVVAAGQNPFSSQADNLQQPSVEISRNPAEKEYLINVNSTDNFLPNKDLAGNSKGPQKPQKGLTLSEAQSTIELVQPKEASAGGGFSGPTTSSKADNRLLHVKSARELEDPKKISNVQLGSRNVNEHHYSSQSLNLKQVEQLKERLRSRATMLGQQQQKTNAGLPFVYDPIEQRKQQQQHYMFRQYSQTDQSTLENLSLAERQRAIDNFKPVAALDVLSVVSNRNIDFVSKSGYDQYGGNAQSKVGSTHAPLSTVQATTKQTNGQQSTMQYSSQGKLTSQSNRRVKNKRFSKQVSVGNQISDPLGVLASVRSSIISPMVVRDYAHQKDGLKKNNLPTSKSQLTLSENHHRQQTLNDEHNSNYQLTNIQINSPKDQQPQSLDKVKYMNDAKQRLSNRPRKLHKNNTGHSKRKKLQVLLSEKQFNGFNKHQMAGFKPSHKVFTQQPNPRFDYETQITKRPITASQFNLNSAHSEAILKPVKGGGMQRQSTTLETLDHASSKPQSANKHFSSRRRVMMNKRQKSSNPGTSPEPNYDYTSTQFNPNQMNKNLQLQSKLIHEKRAQIKQKFESQEQQKFTDKMLQELQIKARVQSSRCGGALGAIEPKPALLGSQAVQQNKPNSQHNNYTMKQSAQSNDYINTLWGESQGLNPTVKHSEKPTTATGSQAIVTRNSPTRVAGSIIADRNSCVTINESAGSRSNLEPHYS